MTNYSKKILNNVKLVKNFSVGNLEQMEQDKKHEYLAVCISDGTFTRGEIEFISLDKLNYGELKQVNTIVVIDKKEIEEDKEA
jgi:hypothetical protein